MFTQSNSPFDYPQILRFGVVGLSNTLLGYGIILAALALGCGDISSNISGYAAGLVLSFVLNSRWTFGAIGFHPGAIPRYAITFLIAYCANLAVVIVARAMGILENPLVHLAGICVYSIISYLGLAHFVFVAQAFSQSKINLTLNGTLLSRRWPEAALLLGGLGAYLMFHNMSLSHDVVWEMWIARQLLGGARLYSEILELNPPLWFWMAVPVEWVAQAFAVPSTHAAVAAVFLLAGASLAVLSQLLKDALPAPRGVLLIAALLATVLIPLPDFAQREHLCLIAAIPYLFLMARRLDNLKTGWVIAVATGLIAAPGFALKHYFIMVPVFLEALLLYKQGRNWTVFRPEIIVLCTGAACYGAAVLIYAPDFLTTIVPMVRNAYDGYEVPILQQIALPHVALWVIFAIVLWRQKERASSLTLTTVVAALAFCLAYFAQQKGWWYHALPVTGCLFLALASLLPKQRWTRTELLKNAALTFCLLVPLYVSGVVGPYFNPRAASVTELLKGGKRGSVAVMLTGNPSNIWPMVETLGFKWPSRHFTFWMLHSIFAQQNERGVLTPELARLADTIRRQTVEDFACNPPDVILIDDFSASKSPGFDVLGFFEQDDNFKQFFSHYTKAETVAIYTSYRKRDDWRAAQPTHCRTIY